MRMCLHNRWAGYINGFKIRQKQMSHKSTFYAENAMLENSTKLDSLAWYNGLYCSLQCDVKIENIELTATFLFTMLDRV